MHVNPRTAILLVAVVPYIWGPYKRKGNLTMPRYRFTFFGRNYYRNGPLGMMWVILAIWLALAAVAFVLMVKHILWCIETAAETGSAIALLVVGLIIPPVGWVS